MAERFIVCFKYDGVGRSWLATVVFLVAWCGASDETVFDDRRALVGAKVQGREGGNSPMGMYSATVGKRVSDKTNVFDEPSPPHLV